MACPGTACVYARLSAPTLHPPIINVRINCILFVQDAEEKLERDLMETRSQLTKRNEEIEYKVKELNELRESMKTAEQERFQEVDKVWTDLF